jgi:hypothetical protein
VTKEHNSRGVYIRTVDYLSYGVQVATAGEMSTGVTIHATGPSAKGVYAESDQNVGVYGRGKEGGYFTTNGAGTKTDPHAGVNVSTGYSYNPGIQITTKADHSTGVSIDTDSSYSEGIDIATHGSYSHGVLAQTDDISSNGVMGMATGTDSIGVYGASIQDTGVYGVGKEGGYFTTIGAGTMLPGNAGVNVSTTYQYNPGIRILTQRDYSEGVSASTEGDYSEGVSAWTHGDYSEGVSAVTYGNYSEGVYARSVRSDGVYAETDRTDHKWGVYSEDYIGSQVGFQTSPHDLAEYMPVSEEVTPGTVVVIAKGGILQPSAKEYDTHVAGIVSTAPGFTLGMNESGNRGEVQIALAGRVPCKVDASNGPIREGDLLTTSNRPGYAMRADPVDIGGVEIYRPGTILGKALGTLESGTGTIEVLVTLQ